MSHYVVSKGMTVGIATKSDMSDVRYGKLWMDFFFSWTDHVGDYYGPDGILCWVLRLNNLFLSVRDNQVEW